METGYRAEGGKRIRTRYVRWHPDPKYPLLKDRSGRLPERTDVDFTEGVGHLLPQPGDVVVAGQQGARGEVPLQSGYQRPFRADVICDIRRLVGRLEDLRVARVREPFAVDHQVGTPRLTSVQSVNIDWRVTTNRSTVRCGLVA
jgi:hypothetical protein